MQIIDSSQTSFLLEVMAHMVGVPVTFLRGGGCFSGGSVGTVSACNAGDMGSTPWLRRSPGEGNGKPLQKCIPLHSHQQCMGDPSTSSFFPILGIISLFNFSHFSTTCTVVSPMLLICISIVTNDIEFLVICTFAHVCTLIHLKNMGCLFPC